MRAGARQGGQLLSLCDWGECAGARQGGQLLCMVVACIQAQGKGGNSLVCVTVACVCRRKARGATPSPWAAWRASCLGATHQSSGRPSWSSWTSRLHRQRWSSNRPPRRRSEWQSLRELRNGLNGEAVAVGSVPHARTPTHKHACMHTLATPHAHTQTHTQACASTHLQPHTHTHILAPPHPPDTHLHTHTCTHSYPPPPPHTHTHTHYSCLNSVHYVEADLCSHFQSELRNGLNGEAVVVGSVLHTRTPTHKHACMHTLATPHANTHMQACMRKHTLATTHTHILAPPPPPPTHTYTHTCTHSCTLVPPPPHTHTHYSCLNSVHYLEADLCSHFQSELRNGLNGEAVVVGSVPHTRTPTHKHACTHLQPPMHTHKHTHTCKHACASTHLQPHTHTHTHTHLHPPTPPTHTYTHTCTHSCTLVPPPPTHTHTHYSCLNSVHYVEADLCSHFQSDRGGGAAWYRSLQEAEGEGPARDLHQLCRHADQAVQEGQRHRLPQTK